MQVSSNDAPLLGSLHQRVYIVEQIPWLVYHWSWCVLPLLLMITPDDALETGLGYVYTYIHKTTGYRSSPIVGPRADDRTILPIGDDAIEQLSPISALLGMLIGMETTIVGGCDYRCCGQLSVARLKIGTTGSYAYNPFISG